MNMDKVTTGLGGVSGAGLIIEGANELTQGNLLGIVHIIVGLALWGWGYCTNK